MISIRSQYQEEFRFETRHQRNVVYVEAKERVFAEFAAAIFGSFPNPRKS